MKPTHFPPAPRAPTARGVALAAQRVSEILPPTPLLPFEIEGQRVWAKAECLQPVGAFKIRGGWHRLSALAEDGALEAGVVAVSSGNHAQGVAWAARRLGCAATIVMPEDAPRVKREATEALGARVVLYDRYGAVSREAIALELCEETGATFVHAFADPWIIEGQGSAGVEIARQLVAMGEGPPTRVITCCGGGGLTAGIALALPDAEIVPVEPEGWDDIARSLETGQIVAVEDDPPATACDALQTHSTAPVVFDQLKGRISFGLSVTEAEVRAAQRFAAHRLRLVLEPGGAVALAAALAGKVALDGTSVLTLSGGNADPEAYAAVLAGDS